MIQSRIDMMKWGFEHPLPENMHELIGPNGPLDGVTRTGQLYAVPIDYTAYPCTEAICLTGLTELGWIFQLVNSPVRYSLHIDGKHKLHHGKWMLVSIGCHDLALDKGDRDEIVHSYRPLVYMFVKQQETFESIKLLCDAVDYLAITCFGADSGLSPGIVNMDHSDGFRKGVLRVWPDAGINTCWPHLKRKVGQGEYLSTQHEFYETLDDIMQAVHFSQTFEMMELLIMQGGALMHETTLTEKKLRTLWNEYFVEPWNCWCFNLHTDTPCDISNNNPIESWHKRLMTMLKKALKGSTASVLGHTFPKVMNHAGITAYRIRIRCTAHSPCAISSAALHPVSQCTARTQLVSCVYRTALEMPDQLIFTYKLPVSWLPTSMYTKAALWLYKHDSGKTPYVHKCSESQYLVLTKAGAETYKKITKKLVERYALYHTIPHNINMIPCDTAIVSPALLCTHRPPRTLMVSACI